MFHNDARSSKQRDWDQFQPAQAAEVKVYERDGDVDASRFTLRTREDEFMVISVEEKFIWDLLDGKRDVQDLAMIYLEKRGRIALGMIKQFVTRLEENGFLLSSAPRQALPATRFVRLPGAKGLAALLAHPLQFLLHPVLLAFFSLPAAYGFLRLIESFGEPGATNQLLIVNRQLSAPLCLAFLLCFPVASLLRVLCKIALLGREKLPIQDLGISFHAVPGFHARLPSVSALSPGRRLLIKLSGVWLLAILCGLSWAISSHPDLLRFTGVETAQLASLCRHVGTALLIVLLYQSCPFLNNDIYRGVIDHFREPFLRRASFKFIGRHLRSFFAGNAAAGGDSFLYISYNVVSLTWAAGSAFLLLTLATQNPDIPNLALDNVRQAVIGDASAVSAIDNAAGNKRMALYFSLVILPIALIGLHIFFRILSSIHNFIEQSRFGHSEFYGKLIGSIGFLGVFAFELIQRQESKVLCVLTALLAAWVGMRLLRSAASGSVPGRAAIVGITISLGLAALYCLPWQIRFSAQIAIGSGIALAVLCLICRCPLLMAAGAFIFCTQAMGMQTGLGILGPAGLLFGVASIRRPYRREFELDAYPIRLEHTEDGALRDAYAYVARTLGGQFERDFGAYALGRFRSAVETKGRPGFDALSAETEIQALGQEARGKITAIFSELRLQAGATYSRGLAQAISDRIPWQLRQILEKHAGSLGGAVTHQIAQLSLEQRRKLISSTLLFAEATSDQLDFLDACFSPVSIKIGDDIIRQGDHGDRLFIIATGHAQVTVEDGAGHAHILATLGPGDFFGETALLTAAPRMATIAALEPMELLSLRTQDFDTFLASHPGHRERLVAAIEMLRLVRSVPLFQELESSSISQMVRAMHSLEIADGSAIISQGEVDAKTFYIVYSGRVEIVRRNDDGSEVKVVELGKGEYFGEIALLRSIPRTATVRALGECRVLALDKETFLRVVGTHALLEQNLAATGKRRLMELMH
ncbi:MAG: hypothetical protein RL095_2382 [Verrucomicrobiota bacterium]|jgi:CRP-like cAMP-binding protein